MKQFRLRLSKIGFTAVLTLALVCFAGNLADRTQILRASEGTNSLFGNYLAGRYARSQRDTKTAADFYRRALLRDPDNQVILEQAFFLEATAGNWPNASKLAQKLVKSDPTHRLAQTFLGTKAFHEKRYAQADTHFSTSMRGPIAELTATLSKAWALYAKGQPNSALKLLEKSDQAEWVDFYKQYHRGLIADLAGQEDVAGAAFADIFKKDPRALRVTSAYVRHAANAGKMDLALALLKEHLGQTNGHPESKALLKMLEAKKVPSKLVDTPEQGLAEVFYGLGDALTAEGGIDIGSIYLQLALYVRPDFPLALSSVAHVYETTKKYEEAIAAYDKIPESSPIWSRVQVRKAFNLNSLKMVDEAKDLLVKIADREPDDITPLDALGDILRSHKRFEEAAVFYSRAIALVKTPTKANWSLFYSRGVCYERLKDWPKAEKDLKQALQLDGNQPLVLNYLGYSWVDQDLNLKKAIGLIRKAVKLKPDDGYFVDSLGWAYYRQRDFETAARELEKAVELRPDDSVINDHLGDAYWQVGRRNEARFQWSQSLTLEPDPAEEKKIKAKLKDGLTAAGETKTLSNNNDEAPTSVKK